MPKAALTPVGSGNQGDNVPGRVIGLPLPTMVGDRPLGAV